MWGGRLPLDCFGVTAVASFPQVCGSCLVISGSVGIGQGGGLSFWCDWVWGRYIRWFMFFLGGNVCFLYIAKLFVRRHSSYLGVVAPWERRDGGGTWERSVLFIVSLMIKVKEKGLSIT